MVPKSISDVKELAKMIALAEWAPESYRDIDGNYLQPKIELAIMHGATVGLGPIAAVHSIAVIGGMPSIWGDGALSVIENSGLLEDMIEEYENDDEQGVVAICTMKRRGRATPIVNRFSVAMADQAGLTRNDGPWQTYPARMLRMRARSWTMRDAFADVLRGLHLREEIEDFIESGGARSPPTAGDPSPRPKRLAGSRLGTQIKESPRPLGRHDPVAPVAELSFEDQANSLVNADGAATEMVGQEHLRSIQGMKSPPNYDQQPRAEAPSLIGAASRERPGQDHPSKQDRALLLEINPSWGVQRIFHQYRAALNAICDGPAQSKSTMALFRETNIEVEQSLRAKLSNRMKEIDAIYQRGGLVL